MEQQLADIKNHEQKLMEKTLEFSGRLSRIEAQVEKNNEKLDVQVEQLTDKIKTRLEQSDSKLKMFQDTIVDELHTSVSSRFEESNKLIRNQQLAINEIIKLQGTQGEQINSINNTLKEFTNIKQDMQDHEYRLKHLESLMRDEVELRKEKIKGRWTAIGAAIAAIASVICAILAAVLK